ncbi:hypothetical protein B0T21DRAFT_349481 [Apiosordaria backusii]|uniref:Uncharacterized protein n=1 Tax=Apiosordaria backusii TaxID=314023 RepID=A0AA40BDW1_9PEZI|nr:hypothetical protein B0T21DRAFT_349481 [Apiosordaria backusii]
MAGRFEQNVTSGSQGEARVWGNLCAPLPRVSRGVPEGSGHFWLGVELRRRPHPACFGSTSSQQGRAGSPHPKAGRATEALCWASLVGERERECPDTSMKLPLKALACVSKRFVNAAMLCPGFSVLQKDNIAYIAGLNDIRLSQFNMP